MTGRSYTSPDLLDAHGHLLGADRRAVAQARNAGVEHPSLEESRQVAPALGFHRRPEIVGACLGEPMFPVIPLHAREERVVADQPTQHVQHQGALVVDERAEDARLALDVPEPVAEVDGALVRLVDAPSAKLPQDVAERIARHAVRGRRARPCTARSLRSATARGSSSNPLPARTTGAPVRARGRTPGSSRSWRDRSASVNGVVGRGLLITATYPGACPPGRLASTIATLSASYGTSPTIDA